jgi:NADPH-dependent glutamate synthase beta chain and related oxidoreductases
MEKNMDKKYSLEAIKPLTPIAAIEEASRCLLCLDAPCSKACPAGTDPAKFIRSLRFKNLEGGAYTIRINNPLGSICARVCPTERYCEKGCLRSGLDKPINIGGLQRFLTDYEDSLNLSFYEKVPSNGKKIAIIGGGPSGLVSATELANLGYEVTIYEKENKLGGYLRYGIPEYRLPTTILDKEINRILALGIKVVLGKEITDVKDIIKDYDSIIYTTGFPFAKTLKEFENNRYVVTAIDYLKKMKEEAKTIVVPSSVLIIGGGDVAMDTISSLKMLGADKVIDVVYEEMQEFKASNKERDFALKYVDSLICGYVPTSVKENVVTFKHRYLESTLTLKADLIILAVGQTLDETILPFNLAKCSKEVSVYCTGNSKVFYAGDITPVTEKTVVYAVKTGKEVAKVVNEKLGGK